MAQISNTYQPEVGMERGGDRFYMKEGGEFKFFDTDYTGGTLRNFLRSQYTVTEHSHVGNLWSGAVGSANPLFTPAYGYALLDFPAAANAVKTEILSGSKGDILWIDAYGIASGASIQFEFADPAPQCSLVNMWGSRVSTFTMFRHGLSLGTWSIGTPRIKLVCMEEGQWSIVEVTAGVLIRNEL